MDGHGTRVWIDGDLAPLASAAVRRALLEATDSISAEALSGVPGATTPELVRLRLLARLLGQLGSPQTGPALPSGSER